MAGLDVAVESPVGCAGAPEPPPAGVPWSPLPCVGVGALGAGAGSELRRPLGITIVGGLLLSQFLTLFTTPVIYIYLSKLKSLFRSPGRSENKLSTGPESDAELKRLHAAE